jgi:hypothetical protein
MAKEHATGLSCIATGIPQILRFAQKWIVSERN